MIISTAFSSRLEIGCLRLSRPQIDPTTITQRKQTSFSNMLSHPLRPDWRLPRRFDRVWREPRGFFRGNSCDCHCASSSSSSGIVVPKLISNCCPAPGIPATLHATFSVNASCPDLSGKTFQLVNWKNLNIAGAGQQNFIPATSTCDPCVHTIEMQCDTLNTTGCGGTTCNGMKLFVDGNVVCATGACSCSATAPHFSFGPFDINATCGANLGNPCPPTTCAHPSFFTVTVTI